MTQRLLTDTGIELKIPMEEYNNKDRIEFITNSDGTYFSSDKKHRKY